MREVVDAMDPYIIIRTILALVVGGGLVTDVFNPWTLHHLVKRRARAQVERAKKRGCRLDSDQCGAHRGYPSWRYADNVLRRGHGRYTWTVPSSGSAQEGGSPA